MNILTFVIMGTLLVIACAVTYDFLPEILAERKAARAPKPVKFIYTPIRVTKVTVHRSIPHHGARR